MVSIIRNLVDDHSMSSHRAIAITSLGVLGQVDIPTPAPNSNEVVIEVRYVGLTPADVYQLDRGQLIHEYPAVIGLSGAGYVKAVGDGVTDLKAGDKVRPLCCTNAMMSHDWGTDNLLV